MLRQRGKLVFLAIALATIAMTFWIRESAPSYQKCQTDYQAEIGREKQEENTTSLFVMRVLAYRCTNRLIENHRDAILAVSTVLLTIVTGFLVLVGYRQVTTTRAQLRAYVFVKPKAISLMAAEGKSECKIDIVILNTGQTPAYRVRNDADIRIMEWPLRSETRIIPPKKNPIAFEVSIGPNQSTEAGITKALNIDAEAMTKVQQRIYIVGLITYFDVFNRRQTTEYCASYAGLNDLVCAAKPSGKASGKGIFNFSEHHNKAS